MAEIKYIPVKKLWPHPDNPRKDVGDVTELAESIKANGVLQNLTVVPLIGEITKKRDGESYRVIIGHRRLAAAKLAGLEELPCVVVEMSEREQLSTMLTENMQRSDLTVYEQAQGFQMMLSSKKPRCPDPCPNRRPGAKAAAIYTQHCRYITQGLRHTWAEAVRAIVC